MKGDLKMVATIIPPLVHNKVEKTYVSSKDPHHEINKDKHEKEKREKDPEDIIDLSSEDEGRKDSKDNKKKPELPENPMKGHIDISV